MIGDGDRELMFGFGGERLMKLSLSLYEEKNKKRGLNKSDVVVIRSREYVRLACWR